MNQLVPIGSFRLPALVAAAGERASVRFLEFFAANIRNPHTRRAYARAADEFLAWCASAGVPSIAAVQPVHVGTWIEAGTRELAAPSVKQRLTAIRHSFDWLVTGQVVPVNPASSVRGPRHVVTSGQTPVLDPAEARAARQHRCLYARGPARSRADRADGLFLRPDRRGARHGGRGCLYTVPPVMGAAAREGREAATRCGATTRRISRRVSRRRRPARRSQGAAVPHDRPQHRQAHAHGSPASERLCDSAVVRPRPASPPSSATTVSGRRGSRPISRTAARSRRQRRWRTMRRSARRSSTIAGATSSASMRSSGL